MSSLHRSLTLGPVHWTLRRMRTYRPPNSGMDRYAPLFDFSLDGVALIEPGGVILKANQTVADLLGAASAAELPGQCLRCRLSAEYQESFDSLLELALLQGAQLAPMEMVFLNGEGQRVSTHVSFVRAQVDGKTYVQLLIRDISEWKKVQNQLLQANMELEHAYRATLDGWGRALELRDYETEGHTQRVMEMTIELALHMGVSVEDIVHVRHGALLHDIGKMAIPDQILRKPGPLSDAEWVEMKLHPVYAYQLLRPIEYLQPAIDIPYCHHEKWDGSGYPRGLKGEQIPTAARIFSVVDVWDALRSDRPYRSAWPEDRVLKYIEGSAGTQFDSRVVKTFLEIV